MNEEELTNQELSQEEIEEVAEVSDGLIERVEHGEDGGHKIFFDVNKASALASKQEGVSIKNEWMGLEVSLISKKISASKLRDLAEETMFNMIKKMPCKIPIGVG